MNKNQTFKEMYDRLNKIIEEMKDDNLDLEVMTDLFEEGLTLCSNCQELLNEYNNKINNLIESSGNKND